MSLSPHDRQLVQKLSSRIIEIDRGRLLDWPCDYGTFLKRKEESLATEESQNRLFDKKLLVEEAWLRQGIKARRTRNQGRVNTLLKMRARRRLRQERPGAVSMTLQQGKRSGNLVMAAENVHHQYDEKPVICDFSTVILRQDRVGIIGPNGCGKTTLLRLLLGELSPQQGRVRLGTNLEFVYFDQLREQLDTEKTVFDNVAHGNDTVTIEGRTQHVIGYLQEISLHPGTGAQQSKVPLGRRTLPPAAGALVHPDRQCPGPRRTHQRPGYRDPGTAGRAAPRAIKGTLLLVSHDRAFLNNVVTSTLVFSGQGKIEEYVGGYDDWLRQKKIPQAQAVEKSPAEPPSRPRPATIKMSFKETRELEALPALLEQLEAEKNQLYMFPGQSGLSRPGERCCCRQYTPAGTGRRIAHRLPALRIPGGTAGTGGRGQKITDKRSGPATSAKPPRR